MNALVTTVIPSYNHEKYVAAAVDSCLSQTYRDLEIVVVDDGSQDNSVDLLQTRYAGDPRVKIVTQQNNGAHAAINEGIRQASGEYIAILNSDDVFHHRRIEALIQEVKRENRTDALVFSDLEFVDDKGDPISEHERADEYKMLQQRCQKIPIESLFFAGNVAMTSSNFFFSKTLYESVGAFAALRYTHDWEWALRATARRPPIWVRENLLCYRVHGFNTISESDIWCHIRENAFVHAKAIGMLAQRHSALSNPSRAGRDAYTALLHNKSFLPLPTLYFLMQRVAGVTDAQLLELATADDVERGLQSLAGELGLPTGLFLSVRHILGREHTIAAQTVLIEERWAAIQRMSQEIDSRDRWIADLQERLANADATIASQTALIEERWAAMQRIEAMIRERDETSAAQAQMVEERWAAMQQMGQAIADRDQQIAELQRELREAKPVPR